MDDRGLLFEVVESLAEGRERNAVCVVLLLEPPGADAEFDTTVRHLVDLGHGDREWAGEPERRSGDQGTEPDRRRFPSDAAERHPGVGRAGQPVAVAHREVVVTAEEGTETAPLGALCDRQEVVVGATLLRLGEDTDVAQLHDRRHYRRRERRS